MNDRTVSTFAKRSQPQQNDGTEDMKAVAVTNQAEQAEVIRVLQNSLYPGAKPESIALVLSYCRVNGLDPMLKPVHIVPTSIEEPPRSGNWIMRDVLMPGIADYRIKAARSQEYAGKTEPEFGPDITRKLGNLEFTFPEWCRITVFRIVGGKERPFPAKEYWIENYAVSSRNDAAPNRMWRKRPHGQISKVCEAQALRMAFPEFSGGQPTAEEMEGKHFEGVTLDAEKPQQANTGDRLRQRVEGAIAQLAKIDSKERLDAFDNLTSGLVADIEQRGDLKELLRDHIVPLRARFGQQKPSTPEMRDDWPGPAFDAPGEAKQEEPAAPAPGFEANMIDEIGEAMTLPSGELRLFNDAVEFAMALVEHADKLGGPMARETFIENNRIAIEDAARVSDDAAELLSDIMVAWKEVPADQPAQPDPLAKRALELQQIIYAAGDERDITAIQNNKDWRKVWADIKASGRKELIEDINVATDLKVAQLKGKLKG